MDVKQISTLLSLSEFPIGFGGCRNNGTHFECCEFNITVMDEKSGESIHKIENEFVKIHHCSFDDSSSDTLHQLQNMTILNDEQWKLRMHLSKIKEKKDQIAISHARSCLVDSGILANKARDSVKSNDPFAGVWVKCASYSLADAIFCLNLKRPSPTHMMEMMRNMKKDKVNQTFSIIHQILGIERSSTSLLSRMVKSTVGFSDMVENNGNSEIILKKYDYLVENSLLTDCYFYLGYVNRNIVLKIKNKIHKNPEFIHVLKVGLDIESDPMVIDSQSSSLLQSTNEILGDLKNQT
ncbi:MAG TPA: hypothetical protein VFP45_07055 [Candidatus Nitrosotalea sp.]|jgi:hypothetical protein|nr:hypothetical protein [Candidatus Nitrosotalea sp.]